MIDLLTWDINYHIENSRVHGFRTACCWLKPYKTELTDGKVVNVCPFSTPGCRESCLAYCGHGKCLVVQRAREARVRFLFEDRAGFLAQLCEEIAAFVRSCERSGFKPAIRLNASSDIPWESEAFGRIIQRFPSVQFYDYTKNFVRAVSLKLPNYHLTYSMHEKSWSQAEAEIALRYGVNVAVVFEEMPETFLGRPVISGDIHDLRFLDPKRVVVGLRPKGKARHDRSGFVIRDIPSG